MSDSQNPSITPHDADLVAANTSAAVAALVARREQMGQAITIGEGTPESPARDFLLTRDRTGGTSVVEIFPTDAHGHKTVKPSRIVQGVTLETLDSLITYVNDFKDHGSRLFASISKNSMTAVLDYHQGATSALGSDSEIHGAEDAGTADFGQNTATLSLPYSEEWTRWKNRDGLLMSQQDFARFLYENRQEIASPDSATIIDAVRDLRAARNVTFEADVSMMHDTESFVLKDATDVSRKTGTLDIPANFLLRLPVYFGGELVNVEAMLRTDTSDGKLKVGVKLMRLENIRQEVFQRAVQLAATETGLPVVYGSRQGSVTMAAD
jgi:uncharacterized protein YfdQ (DUF2303 family)